MALIRLFREHRAGILTALGLVLFINYWRCEIKKGPDNLRIVTRNELTLIKATLAKKPTIETASQGGPWVPIRLKEYPEFKFDVGEIKFPALKARKFINEVSLGDSIFLQILTYDYATKITGEKPVLFSEKLLNYRSIEPYEISANGTQYMKLADTNAAWKENDESMRWLLYWMAGVLIMACLIYLALRLTGTWKKLETLFNRTEF
jgi:hypothetical protein